MIDLESINIYTWGLTSLSVCAPAAMPLEQLTDAVNALHPTGLEHGWSLSTDTVFSGGEPMPCVCQQDSARLHYLFSC